MISLTNTHHVCLAVVFELAWKHVVQPNLAHAVIIAIQRANCGFINSVGHT